jgi:hypothetical protein
VKSFDNFSLWGAAVLGLVLPILFSLALALLGMKVTPGMAVFGAGLFIFMTLCACVGVLVARARRG